MAYLGEGPEGPPHAILAKNEKRYRRKEEKMAGQATTGPPL